MLTVPLAAALFLPVTGAGQSSRPATPKPAKGPAAQTGAAKKPADKAPVPRRVQREEEAAAKPQAPARPAPADKEQFEAEMRVALIVAPKYGGSQLTPLRWTLADATEMAQELERQGYKVRIIKNNEAYAENIRQAFRSQALLLEGRPNATFVFVFTGHGFAVPEKGNYLVTTDLTEPGEAPLEQRIVNQSLSLEEVQRLMAATGVKRKVIFIDACRNDPNAKSAGVTRSIEKFQEAEGFSILLSTAPGSLSYEDPALQHGVFTHFLLEGMRGKAAGPDRFVTFLDLKKYVEDRVVSHTSSLDPIQKPMSLGENRGEFLIATAPALKEEEKPKLELAKAMSSEDVVLRSPELGKSFFVVRNQDILSLYDSSTLQPYVAGLKQTASGEGFARFEGMGPQNTLMHIVLETSGEAIKVVKGRFGPACPNDQICGQKPVELRGDPKLPADDLLKKCKLLLQSGSLIPQAWKLKLGNIARGCTTVAEAVAQFDQLRKVNWTTSFTLAESYRRAEPPRQ